MRSNSFLNKLIVLVVVTVPLFATLLAITLLWERAVHWSDLVLLAIMYSLVGLGVTVGFHRMLTHRSFRPHPLVKFLLLVLGSMSIEGPALDWTATHIKHHAQSDRPGDPHSPLEGLNEGISFLLRKSWCFEVLLRQQLRGMYDVGRRKDKLDKPLNARTSSTRPPQHSFPNSNVEVSRWRETSSRDQEHHRLLRIAPQ